MSEVLVLFYSHSGSVQELARHIARGIDSVAGMAARLRTVPKVAAITLWPHQTFRLKGHHTLPLETLPNAWDWHWARLPASAIWQPRSNISSTVLVANGCAAR